MTYEFVDDVSIADVAFVAEGKTLEELFESCALATFEVMADLESVGNEITKEITLQNENIDKLLFEFLEELIYLKDSDYIIFTEFNITIEEGYTLTVKASGSTIDPEVQELKTDVKAVTFHRFEVKEENGKWKAKVVLDI